MNVAQLSVEEIKSLEEQIRMRKVADEKANRQQVREQCLEYVRSRGYTFEELFLKTKQGTRVKAAIKYRHPSNASLQWSGRGITAVWVREWVANGGTMDQLRVA